MADADGNQDARLCEQIQSVEVDNGGANEEWVYINWVNRGREEEEGITGEHNYEVTTEGRTCDTDILTVETEENNERRASQDGIINGESGFGRTVSEESDDVSVITDSDMELEQEEDMMNVTFGELRQYQGNMCGPLRMFEGPPTQSSQGGMQLNLIIACSIGVLIGLALSKIFLIAHIYSVSNKLDIETIRAENDNLVQRLNELYEVKLVLDQIKDSMPCDRKISRHEKKKFFKKYSYLRQAVKILDIKSFHATSTMLNQLHISLSTLSSTINEIENVDVSYKLGVNRTLNILSDLNLFQNVMINLAGQIQNADKPIEARFLQSANDRIRRVSESLLSELSDTVYDLTINIYNKFDNVRYKLNKRLCCLKSTLSNSDNFLSKLDNSNMFLNNCEKILDIKCNVSEELHSKQRRKRHGGKTKQGKEKNKGEKASQAETKNVTDKLSASKNGSVESSKGYCSKNKSINPAIIGPLLREEVCPTQQTRSLYSEVVAGKVGSHTMNRNTNEIQGSSLSRDALRNTDVRTANTSSIDLTNKDTKKQLNRNGTKTSDLGDLKGGCKRVNETANVKTPLPVDSNVALLYSFDDVSEDSSNSVTKKKKKTYPSSVSDKKSKNKFKGSGKNYTKIKKGQKNVSYKCSKGEFSSTCDKRQPKEKNQQKHFDGNWQFKRSRSRENQRYSDTTNIENPSTWYFSRARSRKNARDRMDFDEEIHKLDPDCCDWRNGDSEEGFINDWFEKKRANSRKRSPDGYRFSMKNIVNMSHRRNILQTRRR